MASTPRADAAELATAARTSAGGDRAAASGEHLLGIGAAATLVGVAERALRYYQQLGLIVPACTTPGGLRRYSEEDLARVARIRELQACLASTSTRSRSCCAARTGWRRSVSLITTSAPATTKRRRLTLECVALQENLRATVEAKRAALESFLADLDARIGRARDLLAGRENSRG